MIFLLYFIGLLFGVTGYFFAYSIFLNEKQKKWWIIYILVSVVYLTSYIFFPEKESKGFISHILGNIAFIVAILCFSKGGIVLNIKNLFIVLGLCFCIEYFSDIIIRLVETGVGIGMGNAYKQFFSDMFLLIIMVILIVVKEKTIKKHGQQKCLLVDKVKIFMVFLVAGIIITIFIIDLLSDYAESQKVKSVMLATTAISAFCVEGFILLILFLRKVYDQQILYTRQIQEMSMMEKHHYEDLLEREVETRKFRHDVKKHFLVISKLAEKNNNKEICEYISDIGFKDTFGKNNYETGNKKIDILTNYYLSMLESDVSVKVTGLMTSCVEIDDASLCVVYGNLLQNAVEAVNKLVGVQNRQISVDLAEGSQFMRIMITNSIGDDFIPDFKTQKTDSKNHGLGLINANKAVIKMGGELNYTVNEKLLTACVTLPVN